MNPYAASLGSRDAFQAIHETTARLQTLVDALGPAGVERPLAPGKWSVRQVLCHLADAEIVFAFRLRQALAEPHHVIQPFDQDRWSERYATFHAQAALDVFTAVRRWNLALLSTVTPDLLDKPLTHPERGPMQFRALIETMAGHDLNHLEPLEAFAAAS